MGSGHAAGADIVLGLTIRRYRESDEGALREICVRTGDRGGDARHLYQDQELLPDIFAVPYTVFDPELAFVADDGGRAVGYIVGTADTPRFVRQFREEWLPRVADRHRPPLPAEDWEHDVEGTMCFLLHHPERMLVPELADYPAHLHIDLLPGYQHRGGGRALMSTFLAAARAAGVPRTHLAMSRENTAARAFYAKMGFYELAVAGPAAEPLYLGRETG